MSEVFIFCTKKGDLSPLLSFDVGMTAITEITVCVTSIVMGLALNATIFRDCDLGIMKGRSLLNLFANHVKRVHGVSSRMRWLSPVPSGSLRPLIWG